MSLFCLSLLYSTTYIRQICRRYSTMPTHESPPPSIRGFRPTTRSRATTPVSRPDTPRASVQQPSDSSSRWGLDGSREDTQKHVNFEVPKEKGTAWYAGFGAAKILEHRWFGWIRPKLKWTFLQPVIRCSVAVSFEYKSCVLMSGMDWMDHSAYTSKSEGSRTSGL